MNQNEYKIAGFIQMEDGHYLLAKYIPGPDDPKHDDLPTEQLKIGEHYNLQFTPVKKVEPPPFNKE